MNRSAWSLFPRLFASIQTRSAGLRGQLPVAPPEFRLWAACAQQLALHTRFVETSLKLKLWRIRLLLRRRAKTKYSNWNRQTREDKRRDLTRLRSLTFWGNSEAYIIVLFYFVFPGESQMSKSAQISNLSKTLETGASYLSLAWHKDWKDGEITLKAHLSTCHSSFVSTLNIIQVKKELLCFKELLDITFG